MLAARWQVRVQITRHARSHSVGKYQSCMFADFEGLEGLFSADGIDPELVFRLFKMQEAKNGGPTEALES